MFSPVLFRRPPLRSDRFARKCCFTGVLRLVEFFSTNVVKIGLQKHLPETLRSIKANNSLYLLLSLTIPDFLLWQVRWVRTLVVPLFVFPPTLEAFPL